MNDVVAESFGRAEYCGERRFVRGALLVSTIVLTLTRMGAFWDVQWHWAVGRDSFWIPPHDLIYAGVAVSSGLGLLMVWWHSRRSRFLHDSHPWGWLLQLIGAGLMVLSAPFDELWHRRYGIDVTIWSPPHLVGVLGGSIIDLGLLVAWIKFWRRTGSRTALAAVVWTGTLVLSLANFGLIPAVRWSVLQPATPVLYSALGSLLIAAVSIALVLITGRPSVLVWVFGGLVVLRLLDQLLWTFSLSSIVHLFGQRPRRQELSGLYRHFSVHVVLNFGTLLAVFAVASLLRKRSPGWVALLSGALAGLSTFGMVLLLSSGRLLRVIPFVDRGSSGRDFHQEADWLLGMLGTSRPLALLWSLVFGLLGGLLGYLFARAVDRMIVHPQQQGRGRWLLSSAQQPSTSAS